MLPDVGGAPQSAFPHRYGPDDVIGAANELTPERTLRALGLARTGRVLSLAQTLSGTSPQQPGRVFHVAMNLERLRDGGAVGTNSLSAAEELLVSTTHNGTHIDGLGHVGIGPCTYNGHSYADIARTSGLTDVGIDKLPPIVTRGVVLDIESVRGRPLASGEVVTTADLIAAQHSAGVEVGPADAVIVHTGWGRLWDTDEDTYRATEPGIGVEAAAWLTDRRVVLVGADNWGVEVIPMQIPGEEYPVHQHCLTRYGCYLVENLRTHELVDDGIREFCFALLPLKLAGLSGSMVNPIAIV